MKTKVLFILTIFFAMAIISACSRSDKTTEEMQKKMEVRCGIRNAPDFIPAPGTE
ncbi:hypothetical protein KAI68_06220 [bacterium]|nr:hypothetical protein [bacterium]